MTVPAPEDLELAKNDVLLQSKIGRSAHHYTVVVSAALVFDALLVLYFQPDVTNLAPTALKNLFFLLSPLGAGLYLSFFGLYIKWEVYQLWPWEAHFSATVGSVILNVVLTVVFSLTVIRYGSFAGLSLLPWFYPLTLIGVSAPIAALVLTWKGWSQGQWIGFISSILPIPVSLVTLFPSTTPGGTSDALALSLVVSAVFYQTAGSFLHLISSGTRSHERELITSHQSRMFQLADEVRERDEALHFRENALLKREADAENLEMSLQRQQESLAEARKQFEAIEADFATRAQTLTEHQAEWGQKSAQVNIAERANKDRELSLQLREEEVARRTPQLSEREQHVIQREGEQTKRDFELTQRQKDVDARYNNLPEIEARLEARKKELDSHMTDLLKKEGELRLRETSLGSSGALPLDPALSMGDLTIRETKLAQLKSVLDEQNVLLGRRARLIEDSVREFKRREGVQSQREAQLATLDATLKQREADALAKTEEAQQRQQQYAAALQELERRGQAVEQTRQELDRRAETLKQSEATNLGRETSVAEKTERLQRLREEMDKRERELLERQRALESRESEVSLRAQEAERRMESSALGIPEAELDTPFAARTSLRSRSRGVTSRSSPSGTFPPRGTTVVASTSVGSSPSLASSVPAPTAPIADTLVAPAATRYADRSPTGTPRLDDLLSGGVPPKGHLMLVWGCVRRQGSGSVRFFDGRTETRRAGRDRDRGEVARRDCTEHRGRRTPVPRIRANGHGDVDRRIRIGRDGRPASADRPRPERSGGDPEAVGTGVQGPHDAQDQIVPRRIPGLGCGPLERRAAVGVRLLAELRRDPQASLGPRHVFAGGRRLCGGAGRNVPHANGWGPPLPAGSRQDVPPGQGLGRRPNP